MPTAVVESGIPSSLIVANFDSTKGTAKTDRLGVKRLERHIHKVDPTELIDSVDSVGLSNWTEQIEAIDWIGQLALEKLRTATHLQMHLD